MTPDEITYLTNAIGHAPTAFEESLYLRLQKYLNRQPTPDECINMSSDTNLISWVIAGL